MKTHKMIIIISFIVTIISAVLVLFYIKDCRSHDISLAITGSAIITLIIETIHYISLREDNIISCLIHYSY